MTRRRINLLISRSIARQLSKRRDPVRFERLIPVRRASVSCRRCAGQQHADCVKGRKRASRQRAEHRARHRNRAERYRHGTWLAQAHLAAVAPSRNYAEDHREMAESPCRVRIATATAIEMDVTARLRLSSRPPLRLQPFAIREQPSPQRAQCPWLHR